MDVLATAQMKMRHSIRFMLAGFPLPGQEFYFVGYDDYGRFTKGEKYKVIATDNFFHSPYEYGIFMTFDDYPNTTDIDYGCFVTVKQFRRQFKRY